MGEPRQPGDGHLGLVILDRQHGGNIRYIEGRGAYHEGVYETDITMFYVAWAAMSLQAWGYDVIVMSDGLYSDRHKRAREYAAQYKLKYPGRGYVYVACHINALTPGHSRTHGLMLHDSRSWRGARLAKHVADAMDADCPTLSKVLVRPCSPSEYRNGFYTISGVYAGLPVGLCFEPFFLDQPVHYDLQTPEGAEMVGKALAKGCAEYLATIWQP